MGDVRSPPHSAGSHTLCWQIFSIKFALSADSFLTLFAQSFIHLSPCLVWRERKKPHRIPSLHALIAAQESARWIWMEFRHRENVIWCGWSDSRFIVHLDMVLSLQVNCFDPKTSKNSNIFSCRQFSKSFRCVVSALCPFPMDYKTLASGKDVIIVHSLLFYSAKRFKSN